ncbi:Uncharacterised protein [Vibrio cholerae]|nr:Uncharacterised protein [Vibrio cholerae]CSI53200.1 Uncharacterised protein [Vibrio cholerae]
MQNAHLAHQARIGLVPNNHPKHQASDCGYWRVLSVLHRRLDHL